MTGTAYNSKAQKALLDALRELSDVIPGYIDKLHDDPKHVAQLLREESAR